MTTEFEGSTNHECNCENAAACVQCACVENKPLSPVIDAEQSQQDREARMRAELEEAKAEKIQAYERHMKAYMDETKMTRWKIDMLEHALLQFDRPGCYGAFAQAVVRLNSGECVCRCDTCKHARDCYHVDEARRGEI